MKNYVRTPAEEFFDAFSDMNKEALDIAPPPNTYDEISKKGKIYNQSFSLFVDSKDKINTLLANIDPKIRSEIYMAIYGYASGLSTMLSLVTPLLPDKQLNCVKMASVRLGRPDSERSSFPPHLRNGKALA